MITSIEVIGLSRTKPNVVMPSLETFLGLERIDFDQNEVIAVIMDIGVLEPVSAELIKNEDGLTLQVTVREKWTIFPMPVVIAGSGGSNFGFFLVDTNAFGYRDMLVLGGMYGSFGWSATAMYNHTPRRNGLPGWNTMFMYGYQEREDSDRDENIHRRYASDQLRASLGINYPFTDFLTASFSISFSDIALKNIDDILNPPENGAAIISFNPGISLRRSSWDGFFLSQQSISLEYSYNYAPNGFSFHQAEFRGIFNQSIIPGFRLVTQSGGVWKSSSDPLFEEGPQRAQVAILPRNYSAGHYAGISAGLEKYLFKFSSGTLSFYASWQGVYSYGLISEHEFNHGPAGGFNFYLSRLALSGMGLIVAYNMNSGLIQFGFNMGMSF